MTEDTSMIQKEGSGSSAFGISIRAWLAIGLAATVCASHLSVVVAVVYYAIQKGDFQNVGSLTTISEPLYTLSVGAISYYFGSLSRKATP